MPNLKELATVTVHVHDDGTATLYFAHMDMQTRRMIPETIGTVQLHPRFPQTPEELLMIAAAERVSRTMQAQLEVPF